MQFLWVRRGRASWRSEEEATIAILCLVHVVTINLVEPEEVSVYRLGLKEDVAIIGQHLRVQVCLTEEVLERSAVREHRLRLRPQRESLSRLEITFGEQAIDCVELQGLVAVSGEGHCFRAPVPSIIC